MLDVGCSLVLVRKSCGARRRSRGRRCQRRRRVAAVLLQIERHLFGLFGEDCAARRALLRTDPPGGRLKLLLVGAFQLDACLLRPCWTVFGLPDRDENRPSSACARLRLPDRVRSLAPAAAPGRLSASRVGWRGRASPRLRQLLALTRKDEIERARIEWKLRESRTGFDSTAVRWRCSASSMPRLR